MKDYDSMLFNIKTRAALRMRGRQKRVERNSTLIIDAHLPGWVATAEWGCESLHGHVQEQEVLNCH
jgi:phosphate-selective porin